MLRLILCFALRIIITTSSSWTTVSGLTNGSVPFNQSTSNSPNNVSIVRNNDMDNVMLGDLEIQESRYSFSLGPLGQRRPLPAKSRQNHPNSFLDNIKQRTKSLFDVKSYYGYLRKAYSGQQTDPNPELLESPHSNRRFFFDFGGSGIAGGFSALGLGSEEKERCQFMPYYNGHYGGGFGGGQSGHFGGGFGGDYNDEGDYFKRKKRSTPIEIKRQGFLADVDGGYGGYNQHYGGNQGHDGYDGHGHGHGHYQNKEHVKPLGYYYCKKGHCAIDGYCKKKTEDDPHYRRPIMSLHYHKRPNYKYHHYYDPKPSPHYHSHASHHHFPGEGSQENYGGNSEYDDYGGDEEGGNYDSGFSGGDFYGQRRRHEVRQPSRGKKSGFKYTTNYFENLDGNLTPDGSSPKKTRTTPKIKTIHQNITDDSTSKSRVEKKGGEAQNSWREVNYSFFVGE